MAEMTREEMIAKVRKLYALAARGGTEAEAALAAERAQLLLTKWNLSHADIVRGQPGEGSNICHKQFDAMHRMPSWQSGLLSTVASIHYCQVFTTTGTSFYTFVGRLVDIEVAQETFVFLSTQIRRLTKRYNPEGVSGMSLQGHRKAFAIGCGGRVSTRLRDEFKRMQEPETAAPTDGEAPVAADVRALVVVSKQQVDTYVRAHFKLRTTRSHSRSAQRHASSYQAGQSAGNTVQLGLARKLGSSPSKQVTG